METLGKGISDGTSQFSIDGQRLYNLINSDEYGQHVITVDVRGKGFQLYTFTFGWGPGRYLDSSWKNESMKMTLALVIHL